MTLTFLGWRCRREKLLPSGVRVRRARSHSLDLDVKVVCTAIDDEIDLAPIREQIGLIGDGPRHRLIYEQDLGDSHLIDLFGNSSVVALGIGPASRDRILELRP